MDDAYDCGLIIRELREKANMTQHELGQKINRDKGTISRYENNYQPVPFETMRNFASIFNVSMDYLAGMEKQSSIPAAGLTAEQTDMICALAELLRCLNKSQRQELEQKKLEILGKLVSEIFKNQ